MTLFWNLSQEKIIHALLTLELWFNEPLYSEVLGITNDIFQPSNSVMYGKEPGYNEPISLVSWHFIKSRFHCM